MAGRNRSGSDVSRFRLLAAQNFTYNHEVSYFRPLLWAVRVMILIHALCVDGKCSEVLCPRNVKYGGVSYLILMNMLSCLTAVP